jgi:hypothetical protein
LVIKGRISCSFDIHLYSKRELNVEVLAMRDLQAVGTPLLRISCNMYLLLMSVKKEICTVTGDYKARVVEWLQDNVIKIYIVS